MSEESSPSKRRESLSRPDSPARAGNFPSLSDFLLTFVSTIPESTDASRSLKSAVEIATQLNKEATAFLNNRDINTTQLIVIPESDLGYRTREPLAAAAIHNKLWHELPRLKRTYYTEIKGISSELLEFATACLRNNYPFQIEVEGFKQAIKDKHQDITDHLNHIQFLKKVASNIQIIESPSTPILKTLYESVKRLYRSDISWMPITELDVALENYIDKSNINLQKCYGFIKDGNFRKVASLFKSISSKLASACKASRDKEVFYSIVARIVFTRAESMNLLQFDNPNEGVFNHNCELIASLTPRDLTTNYELFLPSMLDKSIPEVFNRTPYLDKTIDNLESIPFFSSPIDVAAVCSDALTSIATSISINSYINRHNNGDESQIIPKAVFQEAGVRPFDEVFTIFYMAIATAPPSNILSMASLMDKTGPIMTSSSLEYGASSVQGVAIHITKFSPFDEEKPK